MLKINSAIMDLFYPVGTYYETSNVDFDPNVAWGGTWVLDSQGKVTVSQDTTDSDFATVGATFGEKTHTLTVDEMPEHKHQGIEWLGNSQYNISLNSGSLSTGYKMTWSASSDTSKIQTASAGGSQPHNNVQPCVVVKRWHRTA